MRAKKENSKSASVFLIASFQGIKKGVSSAFGTSLLAEDHIDKSLCAKPSGAISSSGDAGEKKIHTSIAGTASVKRNIKLLSGWPANGTMPRTKNKIGQSRASIKIFPGIRAFLVLSASCLDSRKP